MTEDEALALVRDALDATVPGAGAKADMSSDLVGDEILDSLDVMNFLFEVEQTLGRRLTSIAEDHTDFRVATLVALIRG
jgi:acyl carrier protein